MRGRQFHYVVCYDEEADRWSVEDAEANLRPGEIVYDAAADEWRGLDGYGTPEQRAELSDFLDHEERLVAIMREFTERDREHEAATARARRLAT